MYKNKEEAFSIDREALSGEQDSSFLLHRIIKGKEYFIDSHCQDRILFIMKGNLSLNDSKTEQKIFRPKHMYFLHRREDPFLLISNENTILLEYKSEFLSLINQQSIYKLAPIYAPQPENMEELEIRIPLFHMLNNIIYLKKQKLQSEYLFNIKREELSYFFRTLYNQPEIARFFSPFLQDQNEFKVKVYSKYACGDSVKMLASKCCMTTKTLTRHFKKEFHTTPHQWLIKQKIKETE